jgi:hypothetical protein
MMSTLNPYFIGAVFMVIVAVLFLFTRQWLWSLPFGGGALVLYFLGMSKETDDGDHNAGR